MKRLLFSVAVVLSLALTSVPAFAQKRGGGGNHGGTRTPARNAATHNRPNNTKPNQKQPNRNVNKTNQKRPTQKNVAPNHKNNVNSRQPARNAGHGQARNHGGRQLPKKLVGRTLARGFREFARSRDTGRGRQYQTQDGGWYYFSPDFDAFVPVEFINSYPPASSVEVLD